MPTPRRMWASRLKLRPRDRDRDIQKSLLNHLDEPALWEVVADPGQPGEQRRPAGTCARECLPETSRGSGPGWPLRAGDWRSFVDQRDISVDVGAKHLDLVERKPAAKQRRRTSRTSLTSPTARKIDAEPSIAGGGASAGCGSQRNSPASESGSPPSRPAGAIPSTGKSSRMRAGTDSSRRALQSRHINVGGDNDEDIFAVRAGVDLEPLNC